MGVTLPSYLDEALDLIGVSWPNVDEDDYREMAKAMREFADDIDDGAADAHAAITDLLGSNEGIAVDALEKHWSKVKGTHLSNLAEAGRMAATALDAVAVLIEGAKIAAIAQLGILAAEIAAAVAAAPVTLGLSTLGGLAGTQVCRIAVKRIFKEVCEQIAEQVVDTAMGPVYQALGSMTGDLVVQLAGNALGVRDGVDLGHAAQAGKEGFGEGLDSAKGTAKGAMQIDSAGGGEGGGGKRKFSMDLDAYETAGTQLKGAGGKIRDNAGGKIQRVKTSHSRTKGKDALADAANSGLETVIDGLQDAVKSASKHLDDNMHRGLKQMARNHKDNDDNTASQLKALYHVDDDGKVTRLTSAGHQNLTAEDRKRLGPLLGLDSQDTVGRRAAGDYPLPKERQKKPSREVAPGSTDLAMATQTARHANSDYGRKNKKAGKFTTRNYAAARYGESGSDNEFILVGRSKHNSLHSERMVGIPFLSGGSADGMTELYTERAPCVKMPGGHDCQAWMVEHLPGGVEVSHSFEYGKDKASRDRGNVELERYIDSIKPGK